MWSLTAIKGDLQAGHSTIWRETGYLWPARQVHLEQELNEVGAAAQAKEIVSEGICDYYSRFSFGGQEVRENMTPICSVGWGNLFF